MRQRTGLTIGKFRTVLYGTGKLLGDASAIAKGTIAQRIPRRIVGALFSRILSAIFRR